MDVAYFGTGAFGAATLEGLLLRGQVKVVVTSPDRPAGRGRKIRRSVIKSMAEAAGVPVFQPADVNDPYAVAHIRECGADLGVIIAYGQKIGRGLIDAFGKGMINLHGSLLPKYRGAAPINWAIVNGERETGLTVMQIDERIDAGAILGRRRVTIGDDERADELHDRLAGLGPGLVLAVMGQIAAGTVGAEEQDASLVSRAPKLTKEQAVIDWGQSAERIGCLIRGLWPWPACRARYVSQAGREEEVSFARARAVSDTRGRRGEVLEDLTVGCGRGRLAVLEVKPAGGTLMSWEAFVNGRHVRAGDRFVNDE